MTLTDAQRRLRKSKDVERDVGRWLMEHDGPDPLMSGIASSTGRVGHITGMQIDVLSKSYATEVKNIKMPVKFLAFWDKIVQRAIERGKEPLLVLEPSNLQIGMRKHVPRLHIITEDRHQELLAAEKELTFLQMRVIELEETAWKYEELTK